MKVSFVNFPLQYKGIKKEIDATIQDILNRGDFILRSDVEKFEKTLADYVGTKYAIGVNSGTDALFLSLKALGVKEGDEIIVPGHTFFATLEAVISCGATPVIVDVGSGLLMDVDEVEKAITPRTKGVIPVHLAGACCDMKALVSLAAIYGLFIVEDAAQALGAECEGKKAGSMGIAGCFSFYPAKILGAYGDAGAITTNDLTLANRLCLLRNHGGKPHSFIPGYNSRLDNLQAAVLNVKFKFLDKWIKRREEIAQLYQKGLANKGLIKLPLATPGRVWQDFIIMISRRDDLYEYLKNKGIETIIDRYEFPLGYLQPELTRIIGATALRLPISPELTNREIDYVIKTIKEFYARPQGKGKI